MSKRIDNTSCHCLKMRRSTENVVGFYDGILAPSGVTARQYSLLRAIFNHDGCNVRELSETTLLDRSTLARSLKPLMQAGYIEDEKPAGTRNSILKLTEKGTDVYNEADGLWAEAQRRFEEKIGRDRLAELEDILTLTQNL